MAQKVRSWKTKLFGESERLVKQLDLVGQQDGGLLGTASSPFQSTLVHQLSDGSGAKFCNGSKSGQRHGDKQWPSTSPLAGLKYMSDAGSHSYAILAGTGEANAPFADRTPGFPKMTTLAFFIASLAAYPEIRSVLYNHCCVPISKALCNGMESNRGDRRLLIRIARMHGASART
jgi:hypothetical protein